MGIRLNELTEVSNNSRLTNDVLRSLNDKLDEKELRDFRQWLGIVKRESFMVKKTTFLERLRYNS